MNLGRGLVLGIACIAGIARGAPPIDGHVAIGVRASSTSESHSDFVVNETASVRVAVDDLVGLRFGRTVVGLHTGISTPLRFYAEPLSDSGERVASTNSSIYPFDIGLGVQVDAWAGLWISGWVGATASLTRASSPAAQIEAVDFSGNIPAASWSDHTTSLGYGAALGYDIVTNENGRFAALVSVESQGIAEIPRRHNDGSPGSSQQDLTCWSITLGAAYRY